jgi:HlyD family secretion protein
MKRIALLVLLLIVAATAIGWGLTRESAKPDLAVTAVRRTSVSALGRLEPASRVLRIAAPSGNEGSCLAELFVQEGQDIVQGQLLATMDTHNRRAASVTEAQAHLAAARARLKQIEAGSKQGDINAAAAAVEIAARELEASERDLRRAEELYSRKAISVAERDDERVAYARAQQDQLRAQAQLESVREVRSVDVDVQRAEVELAAAALALAQQNLDATQVRAPVAGRILKIHARAGETVDSDGILELGQVEHMQAVAEVFEGDVPSIVVGQRATIRIDTTGQEFSGQVVEIGHIVGRKVVLTNDPVSDTDARVVEVRIDLAEDRPESVARMSRARVLVEISLEDPPADASAKPSSMGDAP